MGVQVDKRLFKPMVHQEEIFVAEYLVTLNVRQAAILAGYDKKIARTEASRWLRADGPKPHVAFAIKNGLQARLNRLEVTADRVIAELANLAFSNMQDYVELDSNELLKFNLVEMPRGVAAAIKKITIDEYKEGRGENARELKRVAIELHDKLKPLVKLGEHIGIFGAPPKGAPEGFDDEAQPINPDTGQVASNVQINNFNINLIPRGSRFEGGKLIEGEPVPDFLEPGEETYANSELPPALPAKSSD